MLQFLLWLLLLVARWPLALLRSIIMLPSRVLSGRPRS
jgi:hypothetical protein